jgi:cell division septum initiation protein DivIVA
MRKPKPFRRNEAGNVVGAGAAGGGIGTALAAWAANMPQGSQYKALLIVCSPLITLAVSGLWLFVKTLYVDPYAYKKKREAADAAMEKIIADARANAARVLGDANSSDAHKREVRKMLEDLEKIRLRKITERMEVIETT